MIRLPGHLGACELDHIVTRVEAGNTERILPLVRQLIFTRKRMPENPKSGDKPAANFSDVQAGSSSTAPADKPESYTVQSGDSLSKIAKHVYGDANKWHAIYDANRDKIKNPDLIQPGQVLTLPPNA